MKRIKYLILSLLFIMAGCTSLTLEPADFSWPVESVLTVSKDGFVNEERHFLFFNTRKLFLEEAMDSTIYVNKEIRIIRDMKGYYFITSDNFKNVYVFTIDDGELCIDSKILISESGIRNPVFNQRTPYIELVEENSQYLLSNSGIISEGKQ